jgi:hypothetical protein
LDFESEFKIIKTSLERKKNRNEFEDPKWLPGVTQNEMLTSIGEEKPNLIVISMHGSQKSGLLFKGQNGAEDPFSLKSFIDCIRTLTQSPRNRLECIVFSCCHTRAFAEEVTKLIPYSVGIEGPIQDEAMPVFFEGFFNTLYDDKLIKQSFDTGVSRVVKVDTVADNAPLLKIFSSSKIQVTANLDV